jgi:hypothetical protein
MLGLSSIIDGERATGREAVSLAADSFRRKENSTNETGLLQKGSSVSPLKRWPVIQREESRPKAEDERR